MRYLELARQTSQPTLYARLATFLQMILWRGHLSSMPWARLCPSSLAMPISVAAAWTLLPADQVPLATRSPLKLFAFERIIHLKQKCIGNLLTAIVIT